MSDAFFLTKWLFMGMRWLYENVTGQHVVLTIIISTIFIRAITVFGDIRSRRSNMKMQAVQPEIAKLQKKYKDNPQKLQQAQSKLMRENGVSMMGGCLPMLITMPLFIMFISAFRQWGYEQMVIGLLDIFETGSTAVFDSFSFLWVHNIWQPDVGHKAVMMSAEEFLAIPNLQNLIYFQENPAALDVFKQLGFIISDAKNIPPASIETYNQLVQPMLAKYEGFSNGWYILPLLAGATTYLSTWIMQKNQPAPDPNSPTAGTGKMMTWLMPAMSVFFCLSANAAFAIYWTISNIASLGTNILINRKFERERLAGELEANK